MPVFAQTPIQGALHVDRFSNANKLIALGIGAALLTLSSYLEIPMYPVPMTMQTAAELLIGALYGFRLGGATVAAGWDLQCSAHRCLPAALEASPNSMGPPLAICSAF